jgi:hypothetical protein
MASWSLPRGSGPDTIALPFGRAPRAWIPDRRWRSGSRRTPPQRVSLESAAPPRWREQEYVFDVRWPGGRLPIRLELGHVSRQEPVRLAYVDTIEIQRLPP